MFRYLNIILFASILFAYSGSKKEKSNKTINEPIEWTHSWMINTNDTLHPRILIVGDSHVEAYYPFIQDRLQRLANCCKFTTSKSMGDPIFIDQLELIFKQYEFDLICFNNGLHGGGYTTDEYTSYIPVVYALLKKHSKSGVIWVNTTAFRKTGTLDEFSAFNNEVVKRNQRVYDFTKAHKINLIDSYTMSVDHLDYYLNDGIHFNQEGQKLKPT